MPKKLLKTEKSESSKCRNIIGNSDGVNVWDGLYVRYQAASGVCIGLWLLHSSKCFWVAVESCALLTVALPRLVHITILWTIKDCTGFHGLTLSARTKWWTKIYLVDIKWELWNCKIRLNFKNTEKCCKKKKIIIATALSCFSLSWDLQSLKSQFKMSS